MLGHWDPNIGHNQWQFLRMVLCILYSCLLVLRLSFFLSFLFLLLFLSRWLFRFSAPRYGVLVLKLEKKGFVRLNAVCTKVDNMMAEANFHLQSWEMLNRVEGFMAWKPGPASPASSKQRRASRRLTTLSRIGASAKWPGIFFFSTIKRLSKLRQHFSHVGFPFSITSLALAPSNHTPDPKLHNSRCFRRTHCSDTSTLKKAEVPAWSTTKLTWEFTCKVCLRVFPRRSRCFTRRTYYILQSFELRKVQISHSIQLLMCEGLFSLDDFAGWIFLWRCLHWLGRLNVSEANAFNIVLLVVFLDQCIETWDFLITLLELFEKLFFHYKGATW